jgi:hypothetical protein
MFQICFTISVTEMGENIPQLEAVIAFSTPKFPIRNPTQGGVLKTNSRKTMQNIPHFLLSIYFTKILPP